MVTRRPRAKRYTMEYSFNYALEDNFINANMTEPRVGTIDDVRFAVALIDPTKFTEWVNAVNSLRRKGDYVGFEFERSQMGAKFNGLLKVTLR